MSASDTLATLTLEEKIALCSGEDFWHTKAMPGHGIASVTLSDGPHGLRKQPEAADMLGVNESVPATCFPTAVTTACSWDEALLEEMGAALGREARAEGVTVLLGPGANIKRDPTCGRNFEYFSEDPYLTGKLAAAQVRGIESTGVAASLKHFATNSQEYKRFSSDSVIDERTLREIYLPGFEEAVRAGRPSTVMCAYNKINGVHCSDNPWLLTDVLRNEWGFNGMVVTDWGGMFDRLAAFEAGCDLCMPGGAAYMEREAAEAVRAGTLSEERVNASAHRVLDIVDKRQEPQPVSLSSHYDLARRVARESAVLLQNDGILPLRGTEGVVFVGEMATAARYQGAGSSHINPYRLVSPAAAAHEVPVVDAGDVEAIRRASACVVFAGLPDRYESEGFDRDDLAMPDDQVALIEAVAQENPNTVVVLMCGSVVECPWANRVRAVLYLGLGGEAVGDAVCDLLFGRACPAGKLAESWPYRYADCVTSGYYAHGKKDAHYREGLYVGYRYYASAGVPVRWAFGHGLSYTSFAYSDLRVRGNVATCTVRNTGFMAGAEIAQLYVEPPAASYRSRIELKGFKKVWLEPGEECEVSFALDDRSFAVWDGGWVVPGGTYHVHVGAASDDLRLEATVEVPGTTFAPVVPAWYLAPSGAPSHEDFEGLVGREVMEPQLAKGSFTMENTVMEMRDHSLVMRIMFKAVEATVAKGFGGKADYTDPTFRMMMASAADASLSGMKISGGMNNHVLEGMLELANGHYLRGIATMVKR